MVFPSHMFQPPCTAFFPPLSEPISFSSFYLTTPLFAHFPTICLKWPHLPPLILFAPILPSPSLLSPSALLPVSVHRLSTLSSNSITFSLLSFILPATFLPSPTISPAPSYPSENTHLPPLGISHPLNVSSYSLFILQSSVYRILAAFIHTLNAVALLLPSELISISADLQQKFRPLLIYRCFKLDNL